MDDLATRQFLELERRHWWFEGRRRVFFGLLERHLGTGGDRRILDVGCGVGGMMAELQRFGQPVGLELSEPMIRRARERGFAQLLIGSAEELPLRENGVDLISAFDCIEHLERDREALSGFHRALAPGGHLVLSVPAYQFLYADNDRVAQHKRRYTRGELIRRVRDAGFEIVQATHVNFWLFPLILPAVLLGKLFQAMRPNRVPKTNLSYVPARPVNSTLATIFGSERHVLRRCSMPVGHSIFLLARKPGAPSVPTSATEGAAAA